MCTKNKNKEKSIWFLYICLSLLHHTRCTSCCIYNGHVFVKKESKVYWRRLQIKKCWSGACSKKLQLTRPICWLFLWLAFESVKLSPPSINKTNIHNVSMSLSRSLSHPYPFRLIISLCHLLFLPTFFFTTKISSLSLSLSLSLHQPHTPRLVTPQSPPSPRKCSYMWSIPFHGYKHRNNLTVTTWVAYRFTMHITRE